MAEILWSGPGRALQAHLELLGHVQSALSSAERLPTATSPGSIDAHFMQRLNLMTTFTENFVETGAQAVDGQTVQTLRDQPERAFEQSNFIRTYALLNQERELLNTGETHYVSLHVAEAVATAALLAEPEPLFPTDLPSPTGLIVLERPILLPDLHPATGELVEGLVMPVRAIGWHQASVGVPVGGQLTGKPGVSLFLYADAVAFREHYLRSLAEVAPDDDDEADMRRMSDHLGIWMTDMTGWAYGQPWKIAESHTPGVRVGGEVIATQAFLRRWFLAYSRWCWQRILVPETYTPKRHEQRRMRRFGRPEDGYVKVLRLRRQVEAERRGEQDSDGFRHAYAWVVRGHWRRHWYPSLGAARNPDGSFNSDSHRLIWIEAHLSGNPYGEVVQGHNVTAAVR